MLAILTTHPIQYQVPLWQALARDGRVHFEVWFLVDHGVGVSHDQEFGKDFAWDLNMLEGYPHRFLTTTRGATPVSFWKCRLGESLAKRLRMTDTTALWVQGWQVAAYWQAVWAAKRAGVQVWLRGESNDLAPTPIWKHGVKSLVLGEFFRRVDHFLYIGNANRQLYEKYGVPASRLHPASYAVDNDRFARQARSLRPQRLELRKQWGIPEDAFCVLFCGKFIPKKRPHDVVAAAQRLIESAQLPNIHLLFVGSGKLGLELRRQCLVVKDAENSGAGRDSAFSNRNRPPASFAGFLNQTEICQAYVAADCLVLPSDYGETWGLVVNEAMAAGLRCILSDQCGAAMDLGRIPQNRVFPCGNVLSLANCMADLLTSPESSAGVPLPESFSFTATISTVADLCADPRN